MLCVYRLWKSHDWGVWTVCSHFRTTRKVLAEGRRPRKRLEELRFPDELLTRAAAGHVFSLNIFLFLKTYQASLFQRLLIRFSEVCVGLFLLVLVLTLIYTRSPLRRLYYAMDVAHGERSLRGLGWRGSLCTGFTSGRPCGLCWPRTASSCSLA